MSDHEDRLAKQHRRLGSAHPVCVTCPESDPFCLELHHIAGRKHHDDLAIVCRNCHRKLTESQRDHLPSGTAETKGPMETIGHYLLGLADLLAMVARALREFGAMLLKQAHDAVSA
jgi:hypothetical protein